MKSPALEPPIVEKEPSTTRRRFPRLSPWRMRTFDLYVARTFLWSYLVCAVSFAGLFVTIEAFAKLDRFLVQDGPLLVTLWRYHTAMIPTIFTYYIGPVLTAAAGMFTVTLLNRHNELMAVKATGVSAFRVMLPVFVIAVALTALTFGLQEKVLPRFRDAIRTAMAFSKGRPLNPDPFYDAENGLSIKVRQYSTTRQVATGVEVLERPRLAPRKLIDAQQMEWISTGGRESEGYWLLHNGSVQRWNESGSLIVNEEAADFDRLKSRFRKKRLETTLKPIDLETSDLDISYLSWSELRTQFRRQPYHRHLAVKLHLHFAFPLAHVLLLLLAIPVVLKLENRSVLLGVGVSIVMGASFYFLSSICMSIAQDSLYFSPVFAAWLPVMLFGSLGVTLFDRLPT